MNQLKKSKTAKVVAGFVGFLTVVSMVGGSAFSASAATNEELQAQINSLLATITALQAQLNAGSGDSAKCTFTADLTIGSKGADVTCLQNYLTSTGHFTFSGGSTGYFGTITRAAVSAWQSANGVTPTAGYFGSKSRAKYVLVAGTPAGPVVTPPVGTTPSGTGLTVSAGTQPTASLAPTSASRVPFTRITLTSSNDGDIVVNGIVVERTGLAADAAFAGIVLLDENGLQIGIAKTLNSNHQVTVGEPFTIKKGTSKTVTIAGNMASSLTSYAGQVATLSVVGINTSATVTGSLPITGAAQTVNASLTLGSVTQAVSSFDPQTSATKEIGTTGYKFSGVRYTAGSAEKIRLWSIRWNQAGSAGATDLGNVKVVVDGTSYDTVVSSDGKYYTASFGSGILIDKGLSKDIYIQGDLIGSSSAARTVRFDIYKATDVYMTGETYGYGITPPAGSGTAANATSEFTSGTPYFDGSQLTVSAGSVTSVNKALSVPAQNIGINVPNQILGGYEVDLKGEPISVQSTVFHFNLSSQDATDQLLTNVSIYDENGAVVAGPVDAVDVTGTDMTVTFTDTITYPIGKKVYTIKGKVDSGTTNGQTITGSTTPSSMWTSVTGQTTGNTISLSTLSTSVVMNTMTVRSGALGISISTQPPAQSVITGSQGFTYANVLLDASQSGEDVRFSSLPLSMTFATMAVTEITSCQLFDGNTALNTGSNVVNPSGASDSDQTFTFDQSLVVSKGTVKTLALKCNIASSVSAGDTVSWGINAAPTITPTGVTSGNDITETVTASAGQTMTVAASGSYTVTNDASLLYKMAQAGSSGVELARLRFTAGASEAINLKQIALQLGNTASSSPADLAGQTVTLWNGATQIGTAQFGVGASPDNATSTLLSPAPMIAAGESVLITVKGDLTAQNINEGTPGAFISVTYDGDNVGVNGNYALGASSQSNISSGTTADVTTNGMRIFRTVPTIAVTSNGGSLVAGGDLYKFTVTNPNSRDVVFQKFSMSIATSGGATLNINAFTLYGDGVAFNTTATSTVASETLLEFTSSGTSNAQIVPANSTKTYVVRAATVTNPTTAVDSVSLALLADTSFPSQASLMGTVTEVEAGSAATDNIVWSPFSTTTPVATAATQNNLDWTNGYGMPGFPSNTDFTVQTFQSAN